MIILIAESKTMAPCDRQVPASEYSLNCPLTERTVDDLAVQLSDWSLDEISSRIGISISLARAMHAYIYDFPDKSHGEKAVSAYTGVVFKALDYSSLSLPAREFIQKNLRIISSLYGILRPDDIIKPYRLDFSSRAAPGGMSMARYWQPLVTGILREDSPGAEITDILDLMPGDAAKCIDWKALKDKFRRIKIDFKQVKASENGDGELLYTTPMANRLKTLRGKLLRRMAMEGIDSVERLKELESEEYQYDEESSTDTNLVFLTD